MRRSPHFLSELSPKKQGLPQWPFYVATAVVSSVASAFIYRNFIEGEKKVGHPIEADYGVDDPQFINTMNNLLGPPLLDGNEVTILQNGDEIFPAMLEAIRSAQYSITFENFVFNRGSLVSDFVAALAERARAGVRVHFLQDAMGSDCVNGEEMRILKQAGASVEIFRYINIRLNERTHRKLLIIDGQTGFIGGAGISDQWLGNGDKPDIWRDTQYRVRGPVVAQLQQAFMDNWIQTRAELLHGEQYFPQLSTHGSLRCQAFQSSSSEGADCARLMILLSIAAARRSIRIATAYFLPDSLIIDTLVEARRRGVSVEVLVPGPLIDRTYVRWVGRFLWKPLLDAGVKFYEFKPALFHCKYFVVDELWTSVGSCNIDERSLRLNEEANMNVYDADFAKEHMKMFEFDKARSNHVTLEEWQNRPLREKLIGGVSSILKSQM